MSDADVEIEVKPKSICVVVNPHADEAARQPNMMQTAASELSKEGMAVDDAGIERLHGVEVDDIEATFQVHGQHEMARQAIARTTGKDGHSSLCAKEAASYLVDRAIASDGTDNIRTMGCSLLGQQRGVSSILCRDKLVAESGVVEMHFDKLRYACFADRARYGVCDEDDMFHKGTVLLHFLTAQNYENNMNYARSKR